jgi:hypothetical protein
LSICDPTYAGGGDITSDFDSPAQTTDELPGGPFKRQQPGYWLSVLGDEHTLAVQAIQNREALLLEFGGAYSSHVMQC